MQGDARTARANRVADGNRPALRIEARRVHFAERLVQAKFGVRVVGARPGRLAAEHLRGKGFVQLHLFQVIHLQVELLEQLGHSVHRPKTHLARLHSSPGVAEQFAQYRQVVFLHRLFTRHHQHGRAIRDLRAVAGSHQAVLAIEHRLELGERGHVGIAPQAGVLEEHLATGVVQMRDLVIHEAGVERGA